MNFLGLLFIIFSSKKNLYIFNHKYRTDAEKCLQTMVENVTLQKALQALIAGGAR
jgi:hypothetical protein